MNTKLKLIGIVGVVVIATITQVFGSPENKVINPNNVAQVDLEFQRNNKPMKFYDMNSNQELPKLYCPGCTSQYQYNGSSFSPIPKFDLIIHMKNDKLILIHDVENCNTTLENLRKSSDVAQIECISK